MIRLFILTQHLLSTHICFLLCVKLVLVHMLVWAPCISVVHYEIIVDQYIVVSFGYICHALKMLRGCGHTQQFLVSLPTQCTRAPTERRSSPVEAVLTGSRAALLGLVEIIIGPSWERSAINQG